MQLNTYRLVHHVENTDLGKVILPETPRQGNGIVIKADTSNPDKPTEEKAYVVMGTRFIVNPAGGCYIESRVLPEGYKALAKQLNI